MDFERLIELAGRKRPFPVRRISYAGLLADCPMSKAEMLDALLCVRSPDATAAKVRTTLRRLTHALPRAGFHLHRFTWDGPPEAVLRDALRCERTSRMARLTRTEAADAVLRIMAGGEREFWLRNRLGWAFTQGGIISRWAFLDLDGDADEIAEGLFRLDALYLARLAAPEMGVDELVELVVRIRADHDRDFERWRDEDLMGVLEQQLPNAGVSDMLLTTHKKVEAEAIVREALARTRPDPNVRVYRD
jgi:hypothetical protein